MWSMILHAQQKSIQNQQLFYIWLYLLMGTCSCTERKRFVYTPNNNIKNEVSGTERTVIGVDNPANRQSQNKLLDQQKKPTRNSLQISHQSTPGDLDYARSSIQNLVGDSQDDYFNNIKQNTKAIIIKHGVKPEKKIKKQQTNQSKQSRNINPQIQKKLPQIQKRKKTDVKLQSFGESLDLDISLSKNRAGPLIVPYVDYDIYFVG